MRSLHNASGGNVGNAVKDFAEQQQCADQGWVDTQDVRVEEGQEGHHNGVDGVAGQVAEGVHQLPADADRFVRQSSSFVHFLVPFSVQVCCLWDTRARGSY